MGSFSRSLVVMDFLLHLLYWHSPKAALCFCKVFFACKLPGGGWLFCGWGFCLFVDFLVVVGLGLLDY